MACGLSVPITKYPSLGKEQEGARSFCGRGVRVGERLNSLFVHIYSLSNYRSVLFPILNISPLSHKSSDSVSANHLDLLGILLSL